MDEAVAQLDVLLDQQGEDLANDAFLAARAVVDSATEFKDQIRFAIEQSEATEIGRRRPR